MYGSVCWSCAVEIEDDPKPPPEQLTAEQEIIKSLVEARNRPAWRPETYTIRRPLGGFKRFCWNDQEFGPPPDYEVFEVRRSDNAKRFIGYE